MAIAVSISKRREPFKFTEERKEFLAEIFLRGYRKMRKEAPVTQNPDKTWSSRLFDYAWDNLVPNHHYMHDDLIDVIKHLPIDEREAGDFAEILGNMLLARVDAGEGFAHPRV